MAYNDKKKQNTFRVIWRAKRRLEAIERFGGRCQVCGSDQELEFHHKDPSSKIVPMARIWTGKEEKRESELAKCELLCRKCHDDCHRPPLVHGTNAGYERGCKCTECRASNADRQRLFRAKKQQKQHNTALTIPLNSGVC